MVREGAREGAKWMVRERGEGWMVDGGRWMVDREVE